MWCYEPVFKTVKKPVIFLTKEELDKLYKLEIPASGTVLKLKTYEGEEYEKTVQDSAAMSKVRDLFCFSAFTTLRYSDVVEVRRVDIQDGVLNITTQKTHDRLPIVLHKNALAILDKYKDEDFKNGKALPYITNQQMNRALKDLGEICGFNTPLHHHLLPQRHSLRRSLSQVRTHRHSHRPQDLHLLRPLQRRPAGRCHEVHRSL